MALLPYFIRQYDTPKTAENTKSDITSATHRPNFNVHRRVTSIFVTIQTH